MQRYIFKKIKDGYRGAFGGRERGNNVTAISKIKRSNRNAYAQERLKDQESGL